jgi:putative DNA-invertase from lambdoid prophage Rac
MILGYVRVSSPEQARPEKTSLEMQENAIIGFAQMRGMTKFDTQIYKDAGVSGGIKLIKRPAGRELLETARKGDTIVAVKLDRLFRNSTDALNTAEDLKDAGINLVCMDLGLESITGDGVARFIFTIFAALSNMERDRISERTAEGRRAKQERGGAISPAPFGYRKVGVRREARIEIDEREQEVISLVHRRKHKSLGQLASDLAAAGYTSRTGKPYGRWQVSKILRIKKDLSGIVVN